MSKKGRRTVNYNNDCLLDIIERIKPSGAEDWNEVANLYHTSSKELILRDGSGIKRHFIEVLCNKYRKPTGRSAPSARIERAQNIQRVN